MATLLGSRAEKDDVLATGSSVLYSGKEMRPVTEDTDKPLVHFQGPSFENNTLLTEEAPSRRRTRIRAPLACLPCRVQHTKCDGVLPMCSRCKVDYKSCAYSKSRRGGFDKATLLQKRAEKARKSTAGATMTKSPVMTREPAPVSFQANDFIKQTSLLDSSQSPVRPSSQYRDQAAGQAELLHLYFAFFHDAHPFVLPRHELVKKLETGNSSLKHLMLVLQYVGSLYSELVPSNALREDALNGAYQLNLALDGFTVQAHLLLSIALHCMDELGQARSVLDMAISIALATGMNRQEYAGQNGEHNPVLEESWRRTWWSLYITDCLFAGIRGESKFALRTIATTVDLPCEECLYNNGVCKIAPLRLLRLIKIPTDHSETTVAERV